jgi:hypothetical protein
MVSSMPSLRMFFLSENDPAPLDAYLDWRESGLASVIFSQQESALVDGCTRRRNDCEVKFLYVLAGSNKASHG